MRLNKYIAQHTNYSRRGADDLIDEGRVVVDGEKAKQGHDVQSGNIVKIDGRAIEERSQTATTIMLNKPAGFVCSRDGQGSRTVYELLPEKYRHLNAVGRLDKESSGLLLFTNDGDLANMLTHPSYQKIKIYQVELDKPLQPLYQQMISDHGVSLEDGVSKFEIEKLDSDKYLRVTLKEGRNRQIRRTFSALGYNVNRLHRIQFGDYKIEDLKLKSIKLLTG